MLAADPGNVTLVPGIAEIDKHIACQDYIDYSAIKFFTKNVENKKNVSYSKTIEIIRELGYNVIPEYNYDPPHNGGVTIVITPN